MYRLDYIFIVIFIYNICDILLEYRFYVWRGVSFNDINPIEIFKGRQPVAEVENPELKEFFFLIIKIITKTHSTRR